MELHWKDKYDDLENWSHLEVTVSGAPKPVTRLESGTNGKFRLVSNGTAIFWAKIESDWCGVNLLCNRKYTHTEPLITPITSMDIESIGTESKNWSRFFLSSLSNSKNSLLYDAIWHISTPNHNNNLQPPRGFPTWHVYEVDQTYQKKNPEYVDWYVNGNFELFSLKDEPEQESSRVKWFKKLVDQEKCPPVLVWYLNSLQAFVLLDGHSRLKACLEKNKRPKILVLSTVFNVNRSIDPDIQKNVEQALLSREKNPRKSNMPIERINKLLIEVYDDRPFQQVFTKSQASSDLEKRWNKEVEFYCRENNVSQEDLDYFISD